MRGFCLVIAALLGVGRTAAQSAEQQMVQAKQAEVAAKIKGVLTLEDDRARQDRCAHTTTGSNVDFQNCVASELAQTNRDYTTLVLAIGAYLRLPQPGITVKPGRISFDEAETGWQKYRAQICDAVYQSYGLGTGAAGAEVDCEVKVTRHHMHEVVDTLGVLSR